MLYDKNFLFFHFTRYEGRENPVRIGDLTHNTLYRFQLFAVAASGARSEPAYYNETTLDLGNNEFIFFLSF